MDKPFFHKYFYKFSGLIKYQIKYSDELYKISKLLINLKKGNNRLIIFGNGGSSAIASHAAIDFSNMNQISTLNLNDSSMITCFSNDYGYENWMGKAIEVHGKKNDILIVISSSGRSKNIINACKKAKKKKFKKIITFTGFKKNNPVSKLGNHNIWVDSKNYNFVENTHQVLLLSIADFLKK